MSFFMLFETLLPLTILSLLFFCCCCLCLLHRSVANTVARLHQHFNVRVCLLLFLSDPQFFSFLSSLLLFSRLVHAGKSPSTCLSFCLLPPSLVHLSLPWCPCVVVCNWLFVAFPSPLRLCPVSRLLTVVAMSFLIVIFHLIFDLRFNVLYLRDPLWHVFTTIWPLTETYFKIQFKEIEWRGMLCLMWMQYLTYPILFLMKSFFCVHWSSHLYLPSSQPSSKHVRWPDVFVPLVINLEADESICNWLCKAFNPGVFNRHSCLCYRFLQKLFDLWFRCITTESCYYSFALILVVMGSVGFVVSVFIFFTHVGDCLFHIRDYFLDLFVSVIAFFLHFRHGCDHSMELGSDWIVNCLHEMFLSCYLRILSQHQFSRQVTSCLVTEPSWLRTMVPTLSIPWTFFNDETTNVTKKTQRSCYIPRTVQPR